VAGTHGKSGYFAIYDSGGTLRDISNDLSSVNITFDVPTENTEGFGDTWTEVVAGVKNGTFSIEGNYSETASTGTDTVLWGILGSLQEFIHAPKGNTSGNRKWTGSAILTSYNPTTPVGGKISFTGNFQCSGTVTGSTI
jgi:hypothetical protein